MTHEPIPSILAYERTEEARRLRRIYGEHTPIGRSHLRVQRIKNDGTANTISTVTKDNHLLEAKEITHTANDPDMQFLPSGRLGGGLQFMPLPALPLSEATKSYDIPNCTVMRDGEEVPVRQYELRDGSLIYGYEKPDGIHRVKFRIRKLTPSECLTLQCVPSDKIAAMMKTYVTEKDIKETVRSDDKLWQEYVDDYKFTHNGKEPKYKLIDCGEGCEPVRSFTITKKKYSTVPYLSKSALYKLAGNSIAVCSLVQVIETFLRPSLWGPHLTSPKGEELTVFDMQAINALADWKPSPLGESEGALRLISLCSGYDSQMMALEAINQRHPDIPVTMTAWSEFDPESKAPLDRQPAVIAHNLCYPEYANLNQGDMTKVDWTPFVGQCDLLTYSTPCQSISQAGKQAGIAEGSETRSSILWYTENAIRTLRPRYLLQENVKALVSKKFRPDFDKWCERVASYGYHNYWTVLNARSSGLPATDSLPAVHPIAQNRERVFMMSVYQPECPGTTHITLPTQPLTELLRDILESDVAEDYYLKDEVVESFLRTTADRSHCHDLKPKDPTTATE